MKEREKMYQSFRVVGYLTINRNTVQIIVINKRQTTNQRG